jgi:putative tryptophan/tyrosine transport system substrate-binding protein
MHFHQLERRKFITLLGGAVAWPLTARAQSVQRAYRIGYLSSYSAESGKALLACFQDGLRQLGWVEGANLHFDYRWSGGAAATLPALAAELVSLNPDLIFVASTPGTQAMKKATRQIPVVFAGVSDPVASGIVPSLARPEGNITGVSNFLPATSGKLLELLREVVPTATRFAVLRDPNNAGKQFELAELQQAAREMGVVLEAADARSVNDIEDAFSTISKMGPDALITLLDGVTLTSRHRIAEWATSRRLPAIYQIKDFVAAGGLMSYGLNYCQHYRRPATYVDKILRGTKPADLPVELPTTFELIVNLKAAKAIGLTIPETFIWRADEAIE